MKQVDYSKATVNSKQPIRNQTLDFIQTGNIEVYNALLMERLNGNYVANTAVILYGCVNSGSYPAYVITAGAIYYNGVVYLVPASSGGSGSNVAIADLVTTQPGFVGAGTVFSDLTIQQVHNDTKAIITYSTGGRPVTGTVLPDFSNWIPVKYKFIGKHDANIAGGSIFNTSTWTNFDASLTFTTPNDGITRTWRVEFKSWAQSISVPTAQYCSTQFALYAGGGSGTQLDYGTFAMQRVTASTSDYFSRGTVSLIYEGTIPPNTAISVMGKNFSSFDPCDFANNKLLITEVK